MSYVILMRNDETFELINTECCFKINEQMRNILSRDRENQVPYIEYAWANWDDNSNIKIFYTSHINSSNKVITQYDSIMGKLNMSAFKIMGLELYSDIIIARFDFNGNIIEPPNIELIKNLDKRKLRGGGAVSFNRKF